MDEKRYIKRHQLPCYLQVFNRVTNKPLGYIVNISPQGMMLVSGTQLMSHAVFGMQVKLPSPIKGKKRIDFDALSHWSKPDITSGYYDTGFSFTEPPEELTALIDALTEYFSFKDYQNQQQQ
ncbi:MAG: PilZ domain-containing protein [Pseudomonadales bacterium]|nr:PilZ domain-containing protein [Pseudomonadales bacterium]